MSGWMNLPLPVRLACLAVAGLVVGHMSNRVVQWLERLYPPLDRPPRPALQPVGGFAVQLPIVRWIGLRGQWNAIGPGGPLRTVAVELATAAGFAALYWWEIERAGLVRGLLPPRQALLAEEIVRLHWPLLAHLALCAFMIPATLIDIDERIVPDQITVPGTLLGLLLAAFAPQSLLPIVERASSFEPAVIVSLNAASPNAWPAELAGWPNWASLALGMAIYLAWCGAHVPIVWRTRRGLGMAMRVLLEHFARAARSPAMIALAVAGIIGVGVAWQRGGEVWIAALSALVGMGAGLVFTWAVRIVASWALGQEALGFGDVTLMAMIGAFLGWQACPLVFFPAPIAGLVVAIVRWIVIGDQEIYFGPFLCLAALGVIVAWAPLWAWAEDLYALGMFVPLLLFGCVLLMPVLLVIVRTLRRGVLGD